jgi:CPA1 family monovalent cation:H+ antiporter
MVPGLPSVELRPDLVFLLFLPPILYYAGTHTSWRDFEANIRAIGSLAVGLVLFCMIAVALAAHALIPHFSWSAAFVLGAIVSPTDAVAATSILQRLRVPRRVLVILEGESLVNDATALVAYQFAVAAALTGTFSLPGALLRFVMAASGGIAVGLIIGIAIAWIRPRLRDNAVENVVSLLTPYLAYLPADWLGLSGVLAVVTCGIYISRRLGRISTARVRLQAYAVWDAIIFILNGLVFILIGLQLSRIARDAGMVSLRDAILDPLVISAVAIGARMAWVLAATYIPRRLSAKLRARDPALPFKQVFLIAWTQMRGVVSLAAALALPLVMTGNDRDLILMVTFGVILITLVGQGLTLPPLIRAIKIESSGDEIADEEVTARYLAALAAIERLDALGARDVQAAAEVQRLRAHYDDEVAYYARLMNPDGDRDGASGSPMCDSGEEAARAAIDAQHDMILRLRDQGTISDQVLHLIEQELDHEQSRLEET